MLSALGFVCATARMPAWTDLLLRGRLAVCIALGMRFFPVAALLPCSWGSISPSLARAAGVHGISLPRYLWRGAAVATTRRRDGHAAGRTSRHCGDRHSSASLSTGRGNVAFAHLPNGWQPGPRSAWPLFAWSIWRRPRRPGGDLDFCRRGPSMNDTRFELRARRQELWQPRGLASVSFTVTAGDNLAILGSSGSGKSTSLRLLAGLKAPDAGSVFLNEAAVSTPGRIVLPPHRRGVSLVFQDLALWPNLSRKTMS